MSTIHPYLKATLINFSKSFESEKGNNIVHFLRKISYLIMISICSISFSYAEDRIPEAAIVQKENTAEKPFVLPNVSQEEMVLGLLKITENLKTAADFMPSNIEKWLGQPLLHPEPDKKAYYFTGRVTKDWRVFFDLRGGVKRDVFYPLISFGFSEENYRENPSPSMTGACTIDMEDFNQALIKQGYEKYDETYKYRIYKRNKIYIDASQRGENSEKVRHRCIYKVIIRTLDDGGYVL